MPLDDKPIIEFFKNRNGQGRGQLLHNANYYLIRMILAERQFDDVHDLAAFCGNPDSLRTWLPTEADRIIFAEGLREAFKDMGETCGVRPQKAPSSLQKHGSGVFSYQMDEWRTAAMR